MNIHDSPSNKPTLKLNALNPILKPIIKQEIQNDDQTNSIDGGIPSNPDKNTGLSINTNNDIISTGSNISSNNTPEITTPITPEITPTNNSPITESILRNLNLLKDKLESNG